MLLSSNRMGSLAATRGRPRHRQGDDDPFLGAPVVVVEDRLAGAPGSPSPTAYLTAELSERGSARLASGELRVVIDGAPTGRLPKHKHWHSLAVKRATAPAVGLLVLVIALAYTGFLIARDQLALWAVSSAGFPDGMWAAAFDDSVRLVLIGGAEISQGTLGLWFMVHGAVLAIIFSATLATVIRAGPQRVADKSMSG